MRNNKINKIIEVVVLLNRFLDIIKQHRNFF